MAYLEVWDRELVASEIKLMNQDCGQFNGDLFNWLDFIENRHGNIQVLMNISGLTLFFWLRA